MGLIDDILGIVIEIKVTNVATITVVFGCLFILIGILWGEQGLIFWGATIFFVGIAIHLAWLFSRKD